MGQLLNYSILVYSITIANNKHKPLLNFNIAVDTNLHTSTTFFFANSKRQTPTKHNTSTYFAYANTYINDEHRTKDTCTARSMLTIFPYLLSPANVNNHDGGVEFSVPNNSTQTAVPNDDGALSLDSPPTHWWLQTFARVEVMVTKRLRSKRVKVIG